jgi:hypothetical protein
VRQPLKIAVPFAGPLSAVKLRSNAFQQKPERLKRLSGLLRAVSGVIKSGRELT